MNRKTLVLISGNLTAFGPFVTDFYLPCLPELTSFFCVSASVIQVSLTAGMLGLAAGQLLIGPAVDKYGRRIPLLWCLALFVLSTAGCMLSTGIVPFICFRMMQGLTGAGGLVISKVIITDSFPRDELAKYFAILAAVQGIAPILAPVAGSVAFSLSTWQGVFGVLGIWAVILLVVCMRLSETMQEKDRLKLPLLKTYACYAAVSGNRPYLVMNLLQGFASAALIAYISASPFIFQNHFGLTPLEYGLCFAGNAVGLVAGSSLVMKIRDLHAVVKWSSAGLLSMSLFSALSLILEWEFWFFEAFMFLMLFCVGLLTPAAVTLSLCSVNENRGMASALLGAVPFLLGGIVAPFTGMDDIILSTSAIIVTCALVCIFLYFRYRRWNCRVYGKDAS